MTELPLGQWSITANGFLDVLNLTALGGPLTTPGERIESLAFAADGGTLYAGSPHVPLQRYVVDPERAARG